MKNTCSTNWKHHLQMLPADGFGICNLTQNCVIVQEKAFTRSRQQQ
ncbi:hypothetical protein Asd1617_04225 [Shigella dysenteriae 1617]|uniref:Uncharacterized protein n=1 Tax=Shigella dysenteriae 1617 TaxID=754093 RepID=A0A0A6ZYN1_SHIDY|nr:hypothetical protein Asd1617_04225 [Shigella dysenteriae 1617]